MDFESSMSSNSALVMMDGGTGSEHINFKHQQQMIQLGFAPPPPHMMMGNPLIAS